MSIEVSANGEAKEKRKDFSWVSAKRVVTLYRAASAAGEGQDWIIAQLNRFRPESADEIDKGGLNGRLTPIRAALATKGIELPTLRKGREAQELDLDDMMGEDAELLELLGLDPSALADFKEEEEEEGEQGATV